MVLAFAHLSWLVQLLEQRLPVQFTRPVTRCSGILSVDSGVHDKWLHRLAAGLWQPVPVLHPVFAVHQRMMLVCSIGASHTVVR